MYNIKHVKHFNTYPMQTGEFVETWGGGTGYISRVVYNTSQPKYMQDEFFVTVSIPSINFIEFTMRSENKTNYTMTCKPNLLENYFKQIGDEILDGSTIEPFKIPTISTTRNVIEPDTLTLYEIAVKLNQCIEWINNKSQEE